MSININFQRYRCEIGRHSEVFILEACVVLDQTSSSVANQGSNPGLSFAVAF